MYDHSRVESYQGDFIALKTMFNVTFHGETSAVALRLYIIFTSASATPATGTASSACNPYRVNASQRRLSAPKWSYPSLAQPLISK